MVDIARPVYGEAWASVGEKVSPTLTKIQGGWIQEMMPYQWENFLQNRQDIALLYMLQKGVPEWDASQEYIAGKSVVTYQTNLYISVLDSTNVLPTVQASWKKLNPSTSSSGLVTIAGGGTGASTAADARTNLGLGTIATASAPVSNGVVVRSAADTLISRSVAGTASNIVVTNGDGVAGNITINTGSNVALLNTDSSWTSTGSIRLPSGSTSQQGTSTPGRVRFNLETDEFHGAYSDGWKVLAKPASAVQTPITDVGNFYTSSNTEGALQEVGLRASFVKDAILSYPDYAAASAAAATLLDGQLVVADSDEVRGVVSAGTIAQEQSIYKVADYSKIRSYTGRGTRLRVIDNTGAHWWVRKGGAAENGGTVLKDASGRSWVREYSGPVNVRWFGAIGDGVSHPVSEYFTDLDSARTIYPIVNSLSDEIDWVGMQTAINNSGAVLVSDGEYVVNRCVFVDSTEFYGSNGQRPAPNRVAIRGTAAMPINDPVIGLGRSPIVHGFRVGYQTNAITYYETEGQRKAIGTVTSSVDGAVPQRGTSVYGICIDVCGTGIGNVGTNKTMFSTTWDAIEIRRCSYAMIDLQRYGTGNIWGNVYANPLEYHKGLFKPKYGVKLQNCVNDTFIQLNLEHCVFTEAALHVVDHHNLNISSLHIEGIDVAAAGGKFIYSSSSAISINSLTIINCGMSYDNVALVELGSAEMYETTRPSDFRYKTRRSSFCVDKAWFLGLATPNPTHYPDYPFSTRGAIQRIPGFKFFRREAVYSDRDYRLEVNTVNSASYVGTTGEDVVYRYADTSMYSDVNSIDVLRYSGRGRIVHPGKNHILNSAFREWVDTNASSNGTDVECAKDWWVRSPAGYTLRAQKLIDSVGSASPYFMRVSNTETAGGNQRLTTQIRPGSELVGKDICLSFEARTTNSARWIHQIYCVFFTGGSPASVYKQIVFGTSSELAFSNTWREYRIPSFVIPKDAIASIGDGAYLELTFEVSGATVVDTQFDIRNVKLEPGSEWTSFSE